VLLSKRSQERIGEKIKALTPRSLGRAVTACIRELNVYLRGWINFFGKSCTEGVVKTLHGMDAHIRRRLRALLLRQWKRRRHIARRLIRMGARPKTVWRKLYEGRKSLWALSHCSPVDYVLNKAHFAERGLISLEKIFREMHPHSPQRSSS
jgi:RNA-directed DNA polymerase